MFTGFNNKSTSFKKHFSDVNIRAGDKDFSLKQLNYCQKFRYLNNLKYQKFTPSGCKDIGIIKFVFVTSSSFVKYLFYLNTCWSQYKLTYYIFITFSNFLFLLWYIFQEVSWLRDIFLNFQFSELSRIISSNPGINFIYTLRLLSRPSLDKNWERYHRFSVQQFSLSFLSFNRKCAIQISK